MNDMVPKLNINEAIKKNDWSIAPACGDQPFNPKQCDPHSLVHYLTQPSSSMGVTLNLQGHRPVSNGAQKPNLEKTRNEQPASLTPRRQHSQRLCMQCQPPVDPGSGGDPPPQQQLQRDQVSATSRLSARVVSRFPLPGQPFIQNKLFRTKQPAN